MNEILLTRVCLDALEFVFVDVCEERSPGSVSGIVTALGDISCPPLNKTKTHTDISMLQLKREGKLTHSEFYWPFLAQSMSF